jgi:hypothetical protein
MALYSLKDFYSLQGALFIAPEKLTLDYVNDAINRAYQGDEQSAHDVMKVAKYTAPEYVAPQKASISIGEGDNGVVTITSDLAWAKGNEFTLTVVAGDGTLSATLDGSDITVTLADTGSTAELVAGAINAIEGKMFTAEFSGTGATKITDALAKTNFAGGVDAVLTEERQAYDRAVSVISSLFYVNVPE